MVGLGGYILDEEILWCLWMELWEGTLNIVIMCLTKNLARTLGAYLPTFLTIILSSDSWHLNFVTQKHFLSHVW